MKKLALVALTVGLLSVGGVSQAATTETVSVPYKVVFTDGYYYILADKDDRQIPIREDQFAGRDIDSWKEGDVINVTYQKNQPFDRLHPIDAAFGYHDVQDQFVINEHHELDGNCRCE